MKIRLIFSYAKRLCIFALLAFAFAACGTNDATALPAASSPVSSATTATVTQPAIGAIPTTPAQTPTGFQNPVAMIQTKSTPSKTVIVNIEVARTEAQRNTGLMSRKSLAPNAGMIFIFDTFGPNDAFYMKDTYVPLSIAFIDDKETIIDIQDMAALDESLHIAKGSYKSALEVNQGFFAKNGITLGDTVHLML